MVDAGRSRNAIASVALAVTVCCSLGPQSAAAQNVSGSDPLTSLRFETYYVDKNQRPTIGANWPAVVSLRIPLIPGNTFGIITGHPITTIDVKIGEATTLDLEQLRSKVEESVTELNRDASESGLVIEPSTTRLGRLATLAYDPKTGVGIGAAVLRDRSRDDNLVVVYFDRACHLHGVHRGGGNTEATYEVKIGKPGFYLLRIIHETPKRGRVIVSEPPERVGLAIMGNSK